MVQRQERVRDAQVDLLIGIAEKVVVAVSASTLSLVGMRFFRPRVKLSPEMTVRWSEEAGGLRYGIKLVNKSRRTLVDIKFELVLVYKNTEGRNKTKLIKRNRPDPMSIKGRSWRRKPEADSVAGVYTIAYAEDVIAMIAERTAGGTRPAHLRFRCFARDGMSGIGRQFEVKYEPALEAMAYGVFEKGKGFRIEREEPHAGWTDRPARFRTPQEGAPATTGAPATVGAPAGEATGKDTSSGGAVPAPRHDTDPPTTVEVARAGDAARTGDAATETEATPETGAPDSGPPRREGPGA
ncbi:hypothetical protein [Streptomyces sp. NPDC051000]|uniref:hypothetical protein n=1 Tax=unclassified Streptomyces TaxID=2593676 RepID=UPI0033D7C1E5